MNILLFGISNVGKTTTGELLAQRLGQRFYDLDAEVIKYYNVTLEEFVTTETVYGRDKKRGQVIKHIMNKPEDKVFVISPIYYAKNLNRYIDRADVIAIELQDSPENIFERLVFSDQNDVSYKDDEYKNSHKKYYISEIKKDITYYKRSLLKVTNKFHMNNDSPETVVEHLITKFNLL